MNHVDEYKKRRRSRANANAVYDYRERRERRVIARMDAEEDTNSNEPSGGGGHGNTKIPFGLCIREGIEINPDWTPKDAWDALAGKGYSAKEVYKELRETGKVGSKKSPSTPKMSKEEYDKTVTEYEKNKGELDKLRRRWEREKREEDKLLRECEAKEQEWSYLDSSIEKLYTIHGDEPENWPDDAKAKLGRLTAEQESVHEKWAKASEEEQKVSDKHKETDKRVTELKAAVEERREKYRQAVMDSPEYGKVMTYKGYEEKAGFARKRYEDGMHELRMKVSQNESFKKQVDDLMRDAEDETKSAAVRKLSREFAEKKKLWIKQNDEEIERLTKQTQEMKKRLDELDKKMGGEREDSKAWERASKVADENLVVEKPEDWDVMARYATSMRTRGVKYVPIKKYVEIPSEEDIIATVGGWDGTGGSCASVSLAYLANKKGYKVMDFRGGGSRDELSGDCMRMVRSLGATMYSDNDDFRAARELTRHIVEGKEYWFTVGSHAAVVRKNQGKVEYLEMQSSRGSNGWKELTDVALSKRFSCKHKRKWKIANAIIESDKLFESSEVVPFLGYINTVEGKEKKR